MSHTARPARRRFGARPASPRREESRHGSRRPSGSRGGDALAIALILAAALWAYHNSLGGPFVHDDIPRIQRNPYIHRLWPPGEALAHTSRPVVQLTLALNYAMSGLEVWSYHATNLVIHALAALLLFALLRITLARPAVPERVRRASRGIALAAALLWVAHPLTTEAVTYVIQRGESLASLFYLLTLVALARGADSARPWRGYGVSIVACLLGMATKPVMVTAPLMALAYDRTFLSRSFRELWAARGRVHLALFASLAAIPLLLAAAPLDWRYSSGPGTPGVGPWRYAMTEAGVLVHYLALALWPRGLCLDYDWPTATSLGQGAAPTLIVLALVAATAALIARRRAIGFVGVWFFLILAPTSSVIPVLDAAVEHRMYLPLAALTTLAALAGFVVLDRVARGAPARIRVVAILATAALVIALGAATVRRNSDYRGAIAIWTDTIAKRPDNPRARVNLAYALMNQGRSDEAMAQVEEALRREPGYAWAHMALGYFLTRQGRMDDAIPHLTRAVDGLPMSGEAQYLLGSVLSERGELAPAIEHLKESVRLEPWRAEAHNNLGLAYQRGGRPADAIPRFEEAIRLNPAYANAHFNLGTSLAATGDGAGARREFEATLAIQPGHERAREALRGLDVSLPHGQALP